MDGPLGGRRYLPCVVGGDTEAQRLGRGVASFQHPGLLAFTPSGGRGPSWVLSPPTAAGLACLPRGLWGGEALPLQGLGCRRLWLGLVGHLLTWGGREWLWAPARSVQARERLSVGVSKLLGLGGPGAGLGKPQPGVPTVGTLLLRWLQQEGRSQGGSGQGQALDRSVWPGYPGRDTGRGDGNP